MIRYLLLSGVFLAGALLGGCATLSGYPQSSADSKEESKGLAKYFQNEAIQGCEEAPEANRRRCRDEIINGRIRDIDIHFNEFQKDLYREGITSSIAVDWAVLGLSGAGAVTGTAAVKSALSAASGGLVGAKGAFDEKVYFKKTMPVILARMVAERKKVSANIRTRMARENVDTYPLQAALIDLGDYYNAGTIPGAVLAIADDAGKTSQEAERKMRLVFERTAEFTSPDRQKHVDMILDSIDALGDRAALRLMNSPPVRYPDAGSLIERLDPQDRRSKDPGVARQMLKTLAVMSGDRSKEDLDAWNAAVKGLR